LQLTALRRRVIDLLDFIRQTANAASENILADSKIIRPNCSPGIAKP
jgi:hypothetical protein